MSSFGNKMFPNEDAGGGTRYLVVAARLDLKNIKNKFLGELLILFHSFFILFFLSMVLTNASFTWMLNTNNNNIDDLNTYNKSCINHTPYTTQ